MTTRALLLLAACASIVLIIAGIHAALAPTSTVIGAVVR